MTKIFCFSFCFHFGLLAQVSRSDVSISVLVRLSVIKYNKQIKITSNKIFWSWIRFFGMDINYHLLVDVILVSGAVSFVLISRKLKKDEAK